MKILLLTSFFPPTHTAGTEKRTLGYAISLQKQGHNVQVVCAGDWDKGDTYWNGFTDEIYQQIPVRRVHLNWLLAPDPNQYLYCNPVIEKKLGEWIREWRPDILHVTSCVSLSASVIQAAREHSVPVVLTLTDFWFVCPRINLLKGDGSLCNGHTTALDCLTCTLWDTKVFRYLNAILPRQMTASAITTVSRSPSLSRRRGLRGMAFDMDHRKVYLLEMLQTADLVTAPSTQVAQTVDKIVGADLVKVIHSGHDLSWLAALEKKPITNVVRVGYIGQLIPSKGVHLLLSAFLSADISQRAELLVYGDPAKDSAYYRQLKDMVVDLQAGIKFMGAFSHPQLAKVLSEIDVLVVPSLWHENNPRVIQEAFAAQIPVVASNVGGIAEFVKHDVDGLLFERGNGKDLAKQLRRIIDEPELLDRLRTAIPPVRTVDEEISEFVALYKALTGQITPAA